MPKSDVKHEMYKVFFAFYLNEIHVLLQKVATKLKVFFALRGSKGGKEMKPKKRKEDSFDQEKGSMAEKCKGKFLSDFTIIGLKK